MTDYTDYPDTILDAMEPPENPYEPEEHDGWYRCSDCGEGLYDGERCPCTEPSDEEDDMVAAFGEPRSGCRCRHNTADPEEGCTCGYADYVGDRR